MRFSVLALTAFVVLGGARAWPQGSPTGTISGQVSSEQGPLPGVVVAARSPALQGTRAVTTSHNGDYLFALLPPGEYEVRFELSGFRPLVQKLRVAAAQSAPLDVRMTLAAAEATIDVEGFTSEATVSETAQLSTSFPLDLMEKLPIERTVNAAVSLTPGVHQTGPNSAISIAGALSFESLYLVNGVVVNENLRGQSLPLFIEDAVQETTTTTGSISAEYGRFTGGVVNAITKSGGNRFSGSFRTSFTNDDWRATTPFGEPKVKDAVPTYEATLGGPVLRDKLWFFLAGRMNESREARQTSFTNLGYELGDEEKRFEGKLTFSPSSSHTFKGSYTRIDRTQLNNAFGAVFDERSLDDRKLPQDLLSLNYTGIIGQNLFVEAQFSRRNFTFVGSGADTRDLIEGTVVSDRQRNNARYWSPSFCGICTDGEERDNQNMVIKGSYFLSTDGAGSHNLVIGYDTFNDMRKSDNYQSGSSYVIQGTTAIVDAGSVYPVFNNDNSTFIVYYPISNPSQGTDFRTHSLFFNDSWRLNRQVSASLGLRWDRNAGKNSLGETIANDSAFSPRLAVSLDPRGDGSWGIHLGYGKYVTSVANSIGDGSSAGGVPATFAWHYQGPPVNVGSALPRVPTDQALRSLFDWFFANGGTDRTPFQVNIPGVNTRIQGSLKSPHASEYALGVVRRFGNRADLRLDGHFRTFRDFYATRTDTTTGTVTNERGQVFDLSLIENTNAVRRKYGALSIQAAYRVHPRLSIAGNWTGSHAVGSFNGETTGSGPVTTNLISYPEYREARWNAIDGDLAIDQRHKMRLWMVYDVPLPRRLGKLNVSLLESYFSGTPYGAVGTIDPRAYVVNPGYRTPPATVDYWFTGRDAFRTESQTRTDIGINYSYTLGGPHGLELFFQGEVLNVLDESALVDIAFINTAVLTRSNSAAMQPFDPFLEAPERGTHWDLGPQFGRPTSRLAYQTPRTLRFSVGTRF